MNDDLFSRDLSPSRKEPQRDSLFLWTVGILLLIGVALTCWLGSFYIFGHPEKPESYRLLQKLKKLEPPKRFEITQAPPGEFLTPQKAFERYSALSRYQLERENKAMLRDYINNFQATKRLVPYITGRYTIMSSRPLESGDFFGSGVIALAQSIDYPQTLVEHVYTAPEGTVPQLQKMLAPGLDIKMEKTMDLSAIIHVTRLFDGRLQFTVVPLLYGSYAIKEGTGSFSLEPPPILNPAAALPIVHGNALDEALRAYAERTWKRNMPPPRNAAPGSTPAIPVAQPANQNLIVRVEPPATPAASAAPSASPGPFDSPSNPAPAERSRIATAQATPPPASEPFPAENDIHTTVPTQAGATPEPAPAAFPSITPALSPTPAPKTVATTAPTPSATPTKPSPTPATAKVSPTPTPKVALVPFLVSSPTPNPGGSSGSAWRTYAPGRMPRGRLMATSEAGDLAERGTGGERIYLRGSFVVTAVSGNKAVLRPNSGTLANAFAAVTRQGNARVIVEFPAGSALPAENATVSRDELRPFEVRDIRRTSDGQINIYAREVTTP
jgi:hypothetical protein